MVCEVCGMPYDKMRIGMSFKEVRNLIISIGWCSKRNRVKNGRRNGVLGYMHELKLMFWDQHIGVCTQAAEEQARRGDARVSRSSTNG
jgi:hypothetical protein